MKRFILTLIVPFLICHTLLAEKERTISFSFSPEEFELAEENGQNLITTTAYNTVLKEDTLSPALPYICMYVLIGPDEKYVSSSVHTYKEIYHDSIHLAHNPLPVATSTVLEDNSSHSSTWAKYGEETYPDVNVEYKGTHIIDGFKVLSFLVCPFWYDCNQHKLFICHHIDLSLQLKRDNDHDEKASSFSVNQETKARMLSFIANPEHMDMLYTNVSAPSVIRELNGNPTINDAPTNYLIITCDSLKDEFLRLSDWKTERGIKAELMTIEDIYQNYTDRNNPLRIKHAIKDIYNSSNHSLQYVLLGGGKEIVPVQKAHATNGTDEASAPSDLFYACVQNLEWDTNGNGKYGEISDNISVCPDFALGRLPASNVSQAKMMVDKILKYEMNPDTTGWKNKILMCATCENRCVFENDTVSWFHAASERLYSTFISTYWTGKRYRFYDTGTDHDSGIDYNVTSDNLQDELSKGFSFVNVLTHGFDVCWGMETGYDYLYTDAASLQNAHDSFIVTQACRTNNISNAYSLGNKFMQNPNGKVLGYWGCSHDAYGGGYGLGPIEEITGNMYKGLFYSGIRFVGNAIKESQRAYLSNYQSNNSYRWTHMFLLALTDPGLCLYTKKPQLFDQLNISHTGNSITVNLGTPGFYACAMSRHDHGCTYWSSIGSNGSTFSFNNLPGECIIYGWYNDHIPYRTIFAPNVYLQKETLEDNLNVTADNIYIGNNVVSDREEGPVAVTNGKSVISYTSEVVIENSFEVKRGASLEIRHAQ